MKVLICGDRNWTNEDLIFAKLLELMAVEPPVIIVGRCPTGADEIAERLARKIGLEVVAFVPEWKRYGRAAGPMRNKRMLVEGKPDLVIAFHNHISKSKGTKDMVRQARAAGVRVEVVKERKVKVVTLEDLYE